jgi:hypothetical protein
MPYMQGRNLQACKCKPSKILPKLVSLVLMGGRVAVSQSRPGYFLQLNANHYIALEFSSQGSGVQFSTESEPDRRRKA